MHRTILGFVASSDHPLLFPYRDLRPASLEKGQETLRLRVYAAYAWGGPFLVAGVAALLDHLPSNPQYTFLRPRFGEKQCWFYGEFLQPFTPFVQNLIWPSIREEPWEPFDSSEKSFPRTKECLETYQNWEMIDQCELACKETVCRAKRSLRR